MNKINAKLLLASEFSVQKDELDQDELLDRIGQLWVGCGADETGVKTTGGGGLVCIYEWFSGHQGSISYDRVEIGPNRYQIVFNAEWE